MRRETRQQADPWRFAPVYYGVACPGCALLRCGLQRSAYADVWNLLQQVTASNLSPVPVRVWEFYGGESRIKLYTESGL